MNSAESAFIKYPSFIQFRLFTYRSCTFAQISSLNIHTSLSTIAQHAVEKQEENLRFVAFLKERNEDDVDAEVHRLNEVIEPQIDCTSCGNCCKSLMINVTNDEADRVAARLQITREAFDEQYLEKGSHELMIINKIPCYFLNDDKCTIYEDRFAGCRSFLHCTCRSLTTACFR